MRGRIETSTLHLPPSATTRCSTAAPSICLRGAARERQEPQSVQLRPPLDQVATRWTRVRVLPVRRGQ